MAGRIDRVLSSLGIRLPEAKPPVANYVPFVVVGPLVFVSGQIPLGASGVEFEGRVGAELSVEGGRQAARLCALNLLAHLKAACDGDLDNVKRVVRLGGFVNCVEGFGLEAEVVNGASDLMVEVFGEAGRHARAAVGVTDLPKNSAVEIDGIFEIAAN